MIENNYKKQDAENWISKAAKNDADQPLALRVYTSRLIGQNPDLVIRLERAFDAYNSSLTSTTTKSRNQLRQIRKTNSDLFFKH